MKTRILHTRFWQDSYIVTLTHKEKLTFNYLLTNDRVSMTGMYELPDKYIEVDLNLTDKELQAIKKKFHQDKRIFFWNGWIKIINHDKYNSYKGEKIETAKKREMACIPKEVLNCEWGIDTSIHTSSDTPNNQKPKTISIYKEIGGLGERDFEEIANKYQVPLAFVRSKYDDMVLWAGQQENNPKTKNRNWKLTLMAWVKRDAIQIRKEDKFNERKRGIDATEILRTVGSSSR